MRRQVLITLRLTLLRATRTNMAAEVGADAGAVAGCEAAAADHWGCMVGGGEFWVNRGSHQKTFCFSQGPH